MKQQLTIEAFLDLKHMLSDDRITQALFEMEKDKAKHVKVNTDGTIVLGKTAYSWWNRLCGDEITLSANDVCLRLISIITGAGGTRNKDAFQDLHSDFAEARMKENYSFIISRIFIGYRFYFLKDMESDVNCNNTQYDGKKVCRTVNGAIAVDGMGKVVWIPINNNLIRK